MTGAFGVYNQIMKTILVDAVETFIINRNGTWQVFEKMKILLDSFPNKKIILTGAPEDKWQEYGLDKVPYELFTLSHNPDKVNPKYFELMLEHFKLTKDDVVYFEHDPKAVKSAEYVGITSYYYDNKITDLDALKKFLEKNV